MLTPKIQQLTVFAEKFRGWLNRPLSRFWCVIGWLGATAVFYELCGLVGGPTEGDAAESVYSTWAIAHGNLACSYPLATSHHFLDIAYPFTLVAPLYPLLSGAVAFVLRIGHAVPFPSQGQFGTHCANGFVDMFNWSAKSSAILPTVRLSYVVWPVLMVGVIVLLRASGRGRRGWEPFTLVLVACTPQVLMCVTYFFHPQDVMALGLILAGVGCSLKNRWFAVGVLMGLACCTQQYALLIAAPLLIIAPSRERMKYIAGGVLASVLIDVPLIVATSGRAARTILLGSSRVGFILRSQGGTVLWETDFRGPLLFIFSRIVPIVATMVLAWWASKKLGPRLLTPVPLLSVVTTSLVIRLVFEENLYGYYFMAAAVTLILLDVAAGHVRGLTIAWITLATLAFNPIHLGLISNMTPLDLTLFKLIPIVLFVAAVLAVALDAVRRRFRLYKVLWIVVVALTCETRLWGIRSSLITIPDWLWQVVLVPSAFALAIYPLLKALKARVPLETPVTL